ncbi:MAG: hypothetical protein JXB39_02075 [Deltaproteobacteria bacterium]|nr:hypothetical protein [Deltaproteobacteria bacterium]
MHPRRFLPLFAALPWLVAFDYGTSVLISTEDDIYALEYDGEIDEEQRDVLLALLAEPLDPNTATREALQRLPDVTYGMADAIVAARALDPFVQASDLRAIVGRRVWRRIQPFVEVPEPRARVTPLSGVASLRVLDRFADDKAPPGYVRARVKVDRWLEGGLVAAEHPSLYGPDYTGTTPVFEGYGTRVSLKRAHVAARRPTGSVVAGHYGVGFGQRLTFDETDLERPDGWTTDLRITESAKHDGLSVPKRLLGVAASLDRPLESGLSLRATAWGSANPHDLYYTSLDPHDSTVSGGEEVQYPTFPRVYREDLVGLHAALCRGTRSRVGVTAWGGRAVKAYDYVFRSFDLPDRAFYGAVGVDGAWSRGILDLYGEAALTDTGGAAARVESVWNPPEAEITVAVRSYGVGFDNPHSRGSSQPDTLSGWDPEDWPDVAEESTGKRDRDELGPQVKVVWDPASWLRVRTRADAWQRRTQDVWNAWMETRIDLDPFERAGFDLSGSFTDKDLSTGGAGIPYDSGTDDEPDQGCKVGAGAGLRLEPVDPLRIQAWYKTSLESTRQTARPFQRDHYGWIRATWDLTDDHEVSVRGKVYEERLGEEAGVAYWSLHGQVRAKLPGRVTLWAHYERVWDLDDPAADPEQILKAAADVRF